MATVRSNTCGGESLMPRPNLEIASLNLPDLNQVLYVIQSIDLDDWDIPVPDDIIEYGSQTANLFFASPNGSNGAPTFRAIATADIPNLGVTTAKIADLGVTTAKIADLNVTTGKIAADAVTDAKLRDSAALSVIGRSANSVGDPADIVAGSDGHVLRRSGATVGFGTVADSALSANVPLKDTANTFTQKQTLSAAPELALGHTEYGRSVKSGEWADVPFDATDYNGGGAMTVTVASGDVNKNRYTIIGKTLIWTLDVVNMSTGGVAAGTILIDMPDGVTAAQTVNAAATAYIVDDGTRTRGFVTTSGGSGVVNIYKDAMSNFSAAAADTTSIQFTLVCEIQ